MYYMHEVSAPPEAQSKIVRKRRSRIHFSQRAQCACPRSEVVMPQRKEGWMVGRTRHVRVYLTEEEHALLRAAAALADQSLARFSVEAIVETAKRALPGGLPPGAKP